MIARFAVLFLLLIASLGTLFQTGAQPPIPTPLSITIPAIWLESTEEAMLSRELLLEMAFAAARERGMTGAAKHEATFMPISRWELTCRGVYANPDQVVFVIAFDGDKDLTLTMDVGTGAVITYVEFYLIPRQMRNCQTHGMGPTWTATPTAAISQQQTELISEAQNILRERGLATIDMASFAIVKISDWRPTCNLPAALENPDQEIFVFAGIGYPLWRYTNVPTLSPHGQPTATIVFSEMTVAIDIETYEILALDVRFIDPKVDENLGCLTDSATPTP